MKIMLPEVFGCILSLMLCAGCSVKEDRSVCPCRLVLDFSEVDTTLFSYADVKITSPDGCLYEERIESDGFSPEYMVPVPRRQLQLSVWNGRDGLDKAGSYGIQERACLFAESFEGDFFNIIGLPVQKLYAPLKGFGILPKWQNKFSQIL